MLWSCLSLKTFHLIRVSPHLACSHSRLRTSRHLFLHLHPVRRPLLRCSILRNHPLPLCKEDCVLGRLAEQSPLVFERAIARALVCLTRNGAIEIMSKKASSVCGWISRLEVIPLEHFTRCANCWLVQLCSPLVIPNSLLPCARVRWQ